MDTAATARPERPPTVTAAIFLLWTDLGLGLINVFGISAGIKSWESLLIPFYVLFLIMIRAIGNGANWARISYLALLALSLLGAVLAVLGLVEIDRGFALVDDWEQRAASGEPSIYSTVGEDGSTTVHCTVCGLPERNWLQWSAAANIVAIMRSAVLATAMLLLFTRSANRWFRSSIGDSADIVLT